MTYKKISIKALLLWEIATFVVYGCLILLMYFFLVPFTWLWNLLFWAFSITFAVAAIFYFPLLFLSSRYVVTDHMVLYESGVFAHRKRMLVRNQIILVSSIRTPLSWLLGLTTVVISGTGATLTIHFLTQRQAEELLRELRPEVL